MRKLKSGFWLAVGFAALLPVAPAQQAQTMYTYVAEWAIPRAQWEEFTSAAQKNIIPALERLVADGTIAEFALTANAVHLEQGSTHTLWWTAPSFAGVHRVLDEMLKAPANPAQASARHRDRLLRSLVYRSKPGSATSGFAELSVSYTSPGKAQQWRELYDKYTKPVYEKLLADGVILGYGVDVELVHTENPAARYAWHLAPSAEAVDKVNAAFLAERQRRSPEEIRAIGAAFAEATVGADHRDSLDRIVRYLHK
jgi:hypothetical protein